MLEPVFVSEFAPAPEITPDSDRSPAFTPILLGEARAIVPVKVTAVPELLVNAPADETPVPFSVRPSAVAKEKPFRSSVAPLDIAVPLPVVPSGPLGAVPALPSLIVPAEIVVAPE